MIMIYELLKIGIILDEPKKTLSYFNQKNQPGARKSALGSSEDEQES
jgi:hypothetical protein